MVKLSFLITAAFAALAFVWPPAPDAFMVEFAAVFQQPSLWVSYYHQAAAAVAITASLVVIAVTVPRYLLGRWRREGHRKPYGPFGHVRLMQ